uniref:TLC domain-containing protein n=1 Tax=Rhodosorus marinus TaxID=101924 RepID=A0A7S3A002_9RHOD|mmetsp:Transcript_36772/g.147091  ORF Transcript_36772/g.147091 Transcript_36772/m.147091 type:complete len:241 (+) Transcript_36772:80-802(+)
MALDGVEDSLRYLSELQPVYQGYGIAAVGWASLLVPFHFGSLLVSSTYRKDLNSAQRVEWISRCVSSVHALVIFAAFSLALFPASATGEYERIWLCRAGLVLANGYFIYDFVLVLLCIRTITAGPSTLVHHVVCAYVVRTALSRGYDMPMIWAGGFFLTEVSTPLVNWRWFLYFKHKHETVYKVCGILMTLVFFLGRIVYMPVFLVILDKNGMVGSLSKLVTLTLNRLPYRFIFTLRMTS